MLFSKYTKAQLITYLSAPDKNVKQLRDMSTYLYNASNYYRRLIQYYSGMLTYAYVVEPYNLDTTKKVDDKKFKAQYNKTLNYLDKMNMKHEFQKLLKVAFKQDVFYGFIYETNDSFMIQELSPAYCKISGAEDGVYTFAFDNTYFDKYKTELPNFDPDFQTNYDAYKTDSKLRWYQLPASKSICIKINEEVIYPIPPFVSLLSALADIEDYKSLSKASTEINNYKALALTLPTNPETGKYLMEWEKGKEYFNQVSAVLPDNFGAILTPMKLDILDFQKSGVATDTTMIANAESAFWSEACTNAQLFGGLTTNSAALALSAQNDEMIAFGALRQLERWVNARLKSMSGTFKFQTFFLNTTFRNQYEMYKQYLDMGRYGQPMRNAIAATMGICPSATVSMRYLENEVLKLADSEVPLKSSNTQSGSSTSDGRPVQDTVGDAGQATRDGATNAGAVV